MRKILQVDLWDLIDIERLNQILDDSVDPKIIPSDIGYEFLSITKNGTAKIKATFEPDPLDEIINK